MWMFNKKKNPTPNIGVLIPIRNYFNLSVTVVPSEAAQYLVLVMDDGIKSQVTNVGPNGYASILITPNVLLGNPGTLVLVYPGYEHFERRIVTPLIPRDADLLPIVLVPLVK
jgi:hypothetical protein